MAWLGPLLQASPSRRWLRPSHLRLDCGEGICFQAEVVGGWAVRLRPVFFWTGGCSQFTATWPSPWGGLQSGSLHLHTQDRRHSPTGHDLHTSITFPRGFMPRSTSQVLHRNQIMGPPSNLFSTKT